MTATALHERKSELLTKIGNSAVKPLTKEKVERVIKKIINNPAQSFPKKKSGETIPVKALYLNLFYSQKME